MARLTKAWYGANGASVVPYVYEGKVRYTPQVGGQPVSSRSFTSLSAARKIAVAASERYLRRSNPPKGFIPCKAVKITRNRGQIEVRVRR